MLTISIRPLCLPEDITALLALDRSFQTDRIYSVEKTESSIRLVETRAHYAKQYALDMDELAKLATSHIAVVACIDHRIVGLAAAEYIEWNRRVILQHLYVSRNDRRTGIGHCLLENVTEWARTTPARCLWLETQNVNVMAIEFYKREGFALCGFDVSLYGSYRSDLQEIGVFFSKPLV